MVTPSTARSAGSCERRSDRGLAAPARLAAAETLDAPTGVHELLTARVERMAVRADLDVDLALRRASGQLVPAGAAHVGLFVMGMYLGLHVVKSSLGDQLRLPPRPGRPRPVDRTGDRRAGAARRWPRTPASTPGRGDRRSSRGRRRRRR